MVGEGGEPVAALQEMVDVGDGCLGVAVCYWTAKQTLASENFPVACRAPAFSVPTAVDLPIRPLRTP
jgi:hypothetical protein